MNVTFIGAGAAAAGQPRPTLGAVAVQRPTRSDWAVAAAATALQFAAPRAGSGEPPEALTGPVAGAVALLAVLVQGAALLRRRSSPVGALTLVIPAYAVQAALVPGVPPFAGWVAVYAAGVHARPARRAAYAVVAGAGALGAITLASLAAYPRTAALPVLLGTLVAALLAALVRSRRTELEALRERAAALEREREVAVARAALEERLHVARELHDLVGHGLTGIAIQSSTARLALQAGRLPQAAEALAAVETSSRAAMREMRQLLGVLRGGLATPGGPPGELAPAPRLADVPALVERMRAQGMAVTLSVDVPVDPPAAVSLAAYRVVQESLTNAMRHAVGAPVVVTVAADGDTLDVTVDDRGGAARDDGAGGHGLVGMRERVTALSGVLTAGPVESGGWRVRARIPYGGTA